MAKEKTTTPESAVPGAKAAKAADGVLSPDAPAVAGVEQKGHKRRQWSSWFRVAVIVLFGLFYAWDLFEAVGNLLGKLAELASVNEVRELNGFAPIDMPWGFMVANLLLPVVVFGLALLIARKRNVGVLAMVLLAGLGVVAAISLSITSFVLQTT